MLVLIINRRQEYIHKKDPSVKVQKIRPISPLFYLEKRDATLTK